eukprot:c8703_g1_i1 orf=317-1807(+)
MGTESQVLRSEGVTAGAVPSAVDLSYSPAPAADSVPACRSALSIAQPSLHKTLTKESAGGCTACGRDGEFMHRLKQDGAVREFCSSCILSFYKGMYCCLCLVVYENSAAIGDPGLWLTCATCQRMSHLECARDHDLNTASVFFTCHICSQAQKASIKGDSVSTGGLIENGSPPLKKLRVSSDDQQDEALAAAHIVSFLAVQQAKEAKARAWATAAVAAKAAAHAKAALDTAYRVAQEEARWKPESSKRFPGVLPGKHRGLPSLSMLNAPKNIRVEGRAPMPNVPHLLSHSGKDHSTVAYGPLNTKFTGQYHNIKPSLPNADATKSAPSCQDALPRSGAFQRPLTMCTKEALEHSRNGGPYMDLEGAPVSASPASILDAASSLDAPRLNTPTEPGSAQAGMPDATAASAVLTRIDSPGGSSQASLSKVQPTTVPSPVKEILVNSESSSGRNCVIDVDGEDDNPHFTGTDRVAVDDLVDVQELLSGGCVEERQLRGDS